MLKNAHFPLDFSKMLPDSQDLTFQVIIFKDVKSYFIEPVCRGLDKTNTGIKKYLI